MYTSGNCITKIQNRQQFAKFPDLGNLKPVKKKP